MNKIFALARKEVLTYFKSPVAYIILVLTMAIFNIFFFMIIDQNREVSLKDVFLVMEFMLVFIVPLLTMRIFAEEKSTGTIEFLMTAPISNTAIVLGKYLGALFFFSVLIVITLSYYGIVAFFGHPDHGAMIAGYVGIWLEGAFFLAVGMMASAWTRNQMVAAISSYAILFLLYFSVGFTKYVTKAMEPVIRYLCSNTHLANMASGIITIGDLVYFLTGVVACMALTRLSIENRLAASKKVWLLGLSVVLSMGVFVGINHWANGLDLRWDVTRSKQHTVSDHTAQLIRGLHQDIQFTALYTGLAPKYLEDLFKEYERLSAGRIKTEIIDPVEQIGYAAQFGKSIDAKERKVIVRSGNLRRDVDFTKDILTEEELTNAVVRVSRSERHAYFLTGHGEYQISDKGEQGLSQLAALLDSNNILSKELMLGKEGKVPLDCDLLVVAGPHQDLTTKEDAMIEQYLEKGGDALFLVENVIVTTPDKPLAPEQLHKNPSMNSILNLWGVDVQEDVVVDLNSHAGSDVGSPATRNYAKHKAITEGLDYTFYVRPRSIVVLDKRRPSIKL
ncbi:MAG: Gldg family protein, partial [Candidatus Omnitrophica bacterium]|nr:Gldg family protein [Candidatus Omnitrophota bacterium]